ncbi:MAG: hypothetical protein M0P49_02660 [Bacilli bacterium]|nr:hypothetical protein [Bacilli bacterium]
MQAIGIDELAVLESTGAEMVYEAVDIKSVFGKIKEFFVNLFRKIQGIFQKLMALINSWVRDDKAFVAKYKKHLMGISTKDFEYKGYVFTNQNLDIAAASKKGMEIIEKEVGATIDNAWKDAADAKKWTDATENKSDILEKARGAVIGGNPIDSGDFAKELFMFFRNGEDSKVDIDNVSVTALLSIIDGAAEAKKQADKAYREVEKCFKEFFTAVDKAEKELVKVVPKGTDAENTDASVKIRGGSACMQFVKDQAGIVTVLNGAKLSAIKDENRQAKSICVQLMNYAPKNESAFVHTEGSSFLNSVVFK